MNPRHINTTEVFRGVHLHLVELDDGTRLALVSSGSAVSAAVELSAAGVSTGREEGGRLDLVSVSHAALEYERGMRAPNHPRLRHPCPVCGSGPGRYCTVGILDPHGERPR